MSIQEPTLHYTQIVTIKLFTQNFILKSIIPHLILLRFRTIKIQMMILLEEQLINQFNWERAFENKNVDEKDLTFNKTALNIFSNCILHELIVCDDKGPP